MRIPLVAGRAFTEQDRQGAAKVMIISEALARQAFPGQSAVGRRIACCERGPDGKAPDYKLVVGVAADVRSRGPALPPEPEFYLPIAQAPSGADSAWDWVQRTMYVALRTSGDPGSLASGLRGRLRELDPHLPLFDVRTMEERMSETVATARFNTLLLTTLGIIGLALAAIGIYGVIAYFVSQRTREIGVRLALGASPAGVARLVIGQVMRPVLVGLAGGIAGALALGGVLQSQLTGVSARDPATLAAVTAGFLIVALAAAWGPARRAARLDPVRALGAA
jgi:putative ABC transport system permease protein